MKLYWNDEDADIGWYSLYLDDKEMCSICNIAVKYRNWPENQRKRHFGDGMYEFDACFDGCGFQNVMKAKTLEDAKSEVVTWFADYYVKALERAKSRVKLCEEMIKIFKEN